MKYTTPNLQGFTIGHDLGRGVLVQSQIHYGSSCHAYQVPRAESLGVDESILSQEEDGLDSCNGTRAKNIIRIRQCAREKGLGSLVISVTCLAG